MSAPWIKDGKIDVTALDFHFDKVRFSQDAISFIDCVKMIADRINESEESRIAAQEQVKQYEEKINADSRVQELKEELKKTKAEMYRGFRITEDEETSITAWKEKHDTERHGLTSLDEKLWAGGAIGGRYHYAFVPTSIGIVGTCICGSCERKAFAEAKGDRELYSRLKEKYDAEFDFSEL